MTIQKSYYAIIPADVRYSDIPANAKLLYGEITALCNESGYCWATNNYFATLYRVSKNTVSLWIGELKKINAIDYSLDKNQKRKIFIVKPSGFSCGGSQKIVRDPLKKSCGLQNTIYNNTTTISNLLSLNDFIGECRANNRKDIKLIGEWADTIKPDFNTREQWHEFIKRNLRASKSLINFSEDQISKAFEKIEDANRKGWLTKFTLDTVLKFIV